MVCEVVTLPGGQRAIVCSSRKRKRCACRAPAFKLCDWKVASSSTGTCDTPLCATCTYAPAPGKDLCPEHAAEWLARCDARAKKDGSVLVAKHADDATGEDI